MQFYLISIHAPKWSRPKQGQLVSRLFYSNTVSWPLTISVKGKGHFAVVVFFSVIISAYSTSLIIQALSAMCDFLEISKPPKLFIIIIIIIKAIKSNYLTHILPIFIAYLQQTSMGLFTTSAQLRSPLNQSISGMSFNFRLHTLK